MKKLFITLLSIIFFCTYVAGQDVLLEEDVKADTIKKTVGPILKHFTHLYLDLGFIVGESETEGADINYGKSYIFSIGYRYKRKIWNFYAIGFDINYYLMSYNLKQNSFKKLPNDSIHNKEKLIFNNLVDHPHYESNIRSGPKRSVDIGFCCTAGEAGIYADKLGTTLFHGLGNPFERHWMTFRSITSHYHDAITVFHVNPVIGHSSSSKCRPQRGDCGRVSYTCLVFNIDNTKRSHQLNK